MRLNSPLFAGAAEVDITPPIGTAMVGALVPRFSTGIDDPLMAKALVLESGPLRMAVVAGGQPCLRLIKTSFHRFPFSAKTDAG